MFSLKPNITKLKSRIDVQGLIKALEHKNSHVRIEAQQVIVELLPTIIADKSAANLLIEALGHKKPIIYKAISEIFFEFIDILSPTLLLALKNTSPEIKWRGTEVIGRCKFEDSLDILCFNLLNDQNGDVKEASKWALECIGGPVALKCLEESKKKDAYNLEASFKGTAVSSLSAALSGTAVSIEPTQTSTIDKVVEYFYQPITSPAFCSDNQCPCNETSIKKGKGFLYVSKEAVEFRRDARSEKELKAKAAKYIESLGGGDRTAVVLDHMMYKAALICETAAKQRGLNLKVAAADAKYAWKYSQAPLRATPSN